MQLVRKDPRLGRGIPEPSLLHEEIPMDIPNASDMKVFVPAKNFRQSLEFYEAMGWNINWRADDDSLAELELADCRFYLQNYYNEDSANNFMMHITVDDARTWYEHASKVIDNGGCTSTPDSVNLKNSLTARLSLSSGTRPGCFSTLLNTTTIEAQGVQA